MTASTTEEEVLDFTTGASNAEEYKKTEDAARKAARGKTDYFSLKEDGDTAILRFLIEANPKGINDRDGLNIRIGSPENPVDPNTGWLSIKQHSFIKPKNPPSDKPKEEKWPDKMTATCRRTPIGADQHPAFPDCIICDTYKNDRGWKEKPTLMMWTTACYREEVVGNQELVDQGRIAPSQIGKKVIIDAADLIDEVDATGTLTGRKVWKKRICIVNMAVANFFSQLTGYAKHYTTILDRDYRIERKGEPGARKIEYRSVPLDVYQVGVRRDGNVVAINYDLREPEIAAIYANQGPDLDTLRKMVMRRITKEYYDKYFDARVEIPWAEYRNNDDDKAAATPDTPPPPPSAQQEAGQSVTAEPTQGVAADKLKAMRDKVMHNAAATAEPAQPPAEVPPAPSADPTPPPPVAEVPAAPEPAASQVTEAPGGLLEPPPPSAVDASELPPLPPA